MTWLMMERGSIAALGTTINIPLPPGSGTGAYDYAFTTVVIPALRRFSPELILVSSGFDASFADPLGAVISLLKPMFNWIYIFFDLSVVNGD